MTDAGEKLDARMRTFWGRFCGTGPEYADKKSCEFAAAAVRDELERAAEIADISGEPVIATAIRKLKE